MREPIGVIGVILPWNGPMLSLCNRVSPALACGNAVVVKPSEWSSLSAGRLAELGVEAGMPPGLFNVVYGDGRVGSMVVEHPDVGAVSFTGSPPTGKAIARAAAGKTLMLEQGGKSPTSSSPTPTSRPLPRRRCGRVANTGQVCCASTRLLVDVSIATDFVDAVVARTRALRVGDPRDEGTPARAGCVAHAVRPGARLPSARGGRRRHDRGRRRPPPTTPETPASTWRRPSCATCRATPTSGAARDLFGPVLSVQTFASEEEALDLANDTAYGLAANIWTANSGAHAARRGEAQGRHESGATRQRVMDPSLPFGGFKDSGVGNAYGDGAIAGSTRLKRVSVRYGPDAPMPRWR